MMEEVLWICSSPFFSQFVSLICPFLTDQNVELHTLVVGLSISYSFSEFVFSLARWKHDEQGNRLFIDGKPVLEFVAIRRKDNGEWAIPGVSS